MTLVYLDEAGETGGKLDDPSPTYHYVGGLLVDGVGDDVDVVSDEAVT